MCIESPENTHFLLFYVEVQYSILLMVCFGLVDNAAMFQHLDTFKSRSWFKKKKKKAIYLNSLHGRRVYESQWKSIQNETFLPLSF